MVYLYLYSLSLFGIIVEFSKQKYIKILIYFILILSILFVIALRYDSVDYFGYLRIYDEIRAELELFGFFIYEIDKYTPIESGFAILNLVFKYIFDSFYIFIAFIGALSLTIKFTAFKKLSPYFLISILIYLSDEYFWKDLGQIRNALASSFVSIFIATYFGGISTVVTDVFNLMGFDNNSRILKYADSKYSEGIKLFGGTFFLRFILALLMIIFYLKLQNK